LLYLIRLGAVCPSKKFARMTEDAGREQNGELEKKISRHPSTLQPTIASRLEKNFFSHRGETNPDTRHRLYVSYSPAS